MGLDTVELRMDVEEHFGVVLCDAECQKIKNIGDLADSILKRIHALSITPCPSIRAFYGLRAAIRESLDSSELGIRPSTSLTDLIPLSQREDCWRSIKTLQPWQFPRLEMSRRARSIILVVIASLYIIPFGVFPFGNWILSIPVSSIVAIFFYVRMQRYRSDIPKGYATVGDLVRSSIGTVVATQKTDQTTKELVLRELMPIVSQQFGVKLSTLTAETRFIEDLQAY